MDTVSPSSFDSTIGRNGTNWEDGEEKDYICKCQCAASRQQTQVPNDESCLEYRIISLMYRKHTK